MLSSAESVVLNSLQFDNGYTYTQKAIFHDGICEFTLEDTLCIISDAFEVDYNDFAHKISDISALVQEMQSIYFDEGYCEGCGYGWMYDDTTFTLYSHIGDTIQYTTTPLPTLYTGIVRGNVYGSPNIKCGVLISEMFNKVFIETVYYDCMQYNYIVIIPTKFVYSTYHERQKISIPDICILLTTKYGIIEEFEFRRRDCSGQHLLQELIWFHDKSFQ